MLIILLWIISILLFLILSVSTVRAIVSIQNGLRMDDLIKLMEGRV